MKIQKKALVLGVAGVVLLLLLGAFAPAWLFTRLDENSFTGSFSRQKATGRLAATAEDIYLVRAIHARAARQLSMAEPPPSAAPNTLSPSEVLQDLSPLEAAGMLPPGTLALVEGWLQREGGQFTAAPDGYGAVWVRCSPGTLPFSLMYEKEEVTGRILRMWTNGIPPELPGAQPEPAAALEAYLQYCGLTPVEDWAEAPGYYAACLQSQNAKLQAYYSGPFAFGLAPQMGGSAQQL